jgi:hydrogenase maturation protease HycI
MAEWQEPLRRLLGPGLVILGVGNPDRGDDGAGPSLVAALADVAGLHAFDCGAAPENFAGAVSRLHPTTILLADAADFGGRIGEVRLFDPVHLAETDVTTHSLSPGLLLEYLRERCGAECRVMAIQPGTTAQGEPVSRKVKDAVDAVARFIRRHWPEDVAGEPGEEACGT